MPAPLILLQDIHLTFGGTPLLTGADLILGEGERLCLVGRNGSGKSTLLKIAQGQIEADRGERALRQGATVRYLPQEPDLSGFTSVGGFVAAGLGPADDPRRPARLMEALGLTGKEDTRTLSGGEARRAALARTLAPDPDVLLLDEPTNHLDLPAIAWLEAELRARRSALVLISHDRRFLESLSRATVWLDRGRTRRLDQGFAAFEAWRDELLEQEERDRHKLDKKIAMEEDWVRYGVTARRKRNQGRLAGLAALRQERREQRRAQGAVTLAATAAALSGKTVIEAEGIAKSFGGRPIVRDLSLRVRRRDRLGIVGPNGAGKTTLLGLLTGTLAPDAGTVKLGTNLVTVTLDQRRASLDPAIRLLDVLTGQDGDTVQVGGQTRHVMSYLKDFLFTPEQARTPVGRLSGGERGRLMLARAFTVPANLLVLDEPTNDLDLETLDLLQELLADHPATVLVVSHDRDFLDRVATSILAFEGEGRWGDYAGGFSDMLAQGGRIVPLARSTAPAAARQRPPPRPAAPPRGLSSKDERALTALPARIAVLESEIRAVELRLADPTLFVLQPTGFAELVATHERLRGELAATEERWLALELLREEALAGGPSRESP